jgi:2-dehydropantoate 2-reductase
VDPGGEIARHLPVDQVIGALSYCAAAVTEPGVVDHLDAARFPMGELDRDRTERLKSISRVFVAAGMQAPVRREIRQDIWVKLLGNVPFNPISALTRADFAQMLGFPATRKLVWDVMEEVRAVAAKLDIEIPISSERRIAGAEQVGPHRTSMLQDLEAGRPPELDPIVGAVVELAGMVGVAVPNLRALYACTSLLFTLRDGNVRTAGASD